MRNTVTDYIYWWIVNHFRKYLKVQLSFCALAWKAGSAGVIFFIPIFTVRGRGKKKHRMVHDVHWKQREVSLWLQWAHGVSFLNGRFKLMWFISISDWLHTCVSYPAVCSGLSSCSSPTSSYRPASLLNITRYAGYFGLPLQAFL